MEPLISVLIPVYNAEKFIRETIDSVLSQTFANFELLLVDDASTDDSRKIICSYNDHRVKLIECPHNFIDTLNTGLLLAKGKYIALLDHDDLMMPYRLQTQYDFLENNPHIDACSGYMHTFGKYSIEIKAPLSHEDLFLSMIKSNPILNPTCFIRKKFLENNSIVYQNGYSFAADYRFWFDVAKVGIIQTIPKVLTLYRTSDEQASIKYKDESIPACYGLQIEILSYFFEIFDKEKRYEKLLTSIKKLETSNIIICNYNFFLFMYQIILAMKENNEMSTKN